MRRRDALVIGGAMVVAIAIPPILNRIPSEFAFEPLRGFEGFRRLSSGPVSGGIDPFFGLDSRLPDQVPLVEEPPIGPCLSLFGPEGWGEDLPIAIFSDFNCPYCKVLEAKLIQLRDSGAPIRLIWHEMPLLGSSSMRSARAVLTARFLGSEEAARAYLKTHTLRPGPAALAAFATAIDIPTTMLQREYESQRVADALVRGLSLGTRLGIPGTPGTVIGRTLVIGAISDADLNALIALERSTPQKPCV